MVKANAQPEVVTLFEKPKVSGLAIPYRGQPAQEGHEGVLELRKQYASIPQSYWVFDEKEGVINGSTIRDLILLNQVLAPKSQRTLTFEEGMSLDSRKKLSNGVYRDFGLVLYSPENPNSEIAAARVEQAEARGWKLPVLAHPSSLTLGKTGIEILFGDNDSLIVHGEEAVKSLERFNYVYNSGVCRFGRDTFGDWDAGWLDLASSSAGGRVDRVRGEATSQKFGDYVLAEITNEHESVARDFAQRKEKALTAAREILYGK